MPYDIIEHSHSPFTTKDLNDWEKDEFEAKMEELPPEARDEIYKQFTVIWHTSHSLAFTFLEAAGDCLAHLRISQIPDWVKHILASYEEEGLQRARSFMADIPCNYLTNLHGKNGLHLNGVEGLLRHYARGITGLDMDIMPAARPYTDTACIYLPESLNSMPARDDNLLLYKMTVTFQAALIINRTFLYVPDKDDTVVDELIGRYGTSYGNHISFLENFFHLFPDPILARDLFYLAETTRTIAWLGHEFPGLMRDMQEAGGIIRCRPQVGEESARNRLVEALAAWVLSYLATGKPADDRYNILPDSILTVLRDLTGADADTGNSVKAAVRLYEIIAAADGPYTAVEPLFFQGELHAEEAMEVRLKKRVEDKNRFVEALSTLLANSQISEEMTEDLPEVQSTGSDQADQQNAIPPPGAGKGEEDEEQLSAAITEEYITLDDQHLKLTDELKKLAEDIRNDLGYVPSQYISSSMEMAGNAYFRGPGPAPDEKDNAEAAGRILYDEWDFRRADFRRNWCHLAEKEIHPTQGTFISHTLEKHRGLLQILRRQFEALRTQHRFLKRQRDGDDIDIDALIESYADMQAGRPPAEDNFIRLQRSERDIAALFLVDMSSSTEGWVNRTIKEALVLMCESLKVLGDSYAIYGFSGMRRLRSEIYHIKDFDEPYDETVKGRVAAIHPMEYTRMGPPIRHVTNILERKEAKIKLLITLSDGKPEDYDDYKGDYAIEDTRHALIESIARGIHPFCITIDRHAHEYISHMYGETNYIFINDIRKLPVRMPEIYRVLTT